MTQAGGIPGRDALRVVMAGPLPPAVGGMASVLDGLARSSLAARVSLELFDTGKKTPEGRPWWQGVAARLSLLVRWWSAMGGSAGCIAHIHTCSGLTFFLDGVLVLLAKLRGRRCVLHVHGARFDAFMDELNAPARRLAAAIARSADAVVALSEDWRTRLSERVSGVRWFVVENGVAAPDAKELYARATGLEVLFLGNLGERKGVPELLEAFARVSEASALLLAGGEETEGFNGIARERCEALGISHRVRFLGPVVGDAKAALLQRADIFVLPSRAEGLPMALLEAMACGLPVVSTRVGAIPSVVTQGIDGLLIDSGDVEALADSLRALCVDAGLRERLGRTARETCLAGYGVERTVDKLLVLYGELSGRVLLPGVPPQPVPGNPDPA